MHVYLQEEGEGPRSLQEALRTFKSKKPTTILENTSQGPFGNAGAVKPKSRFRALWEPKRIAIQGGAVAPKKGVWRGSSEPQDRCLRGDLLGYYGLFKGLADKALIGNPFTGRTFAHGVVEFS
jgi:hypothetical protein